MSKIFETTEVNNISIKNKIVLPPMCTYAADNTGKVTEFHKVHYGSFSIGQVGLIITEAIAITPSGRISDHDLGIWNDDQIAGLKSIVDFGKSNGSVMGIQLAHAGRKCGAKEESTIYSSSNISFSSDYKEPKKLTLTGIKEIIRLFGKAAKRAEKAGFQLVEIHAAHGYLINQFLSPLINNRTDKYGGATLIDRSTLLVEIIEEIKKNFTGIICVRFSVEEYMEGGNTTKDFIELINELQNVDMINVSTGGVVEVVPPNIGPCYQIDFARQIKAKCDKIVIGGGLVTKPSQISEILESKKCDFVYIGRKLYKNPNFTIKCAKKFGDKIQVNGVLGRVFNI